MKVLLILWAVGLTACEKLDRKYLPPPGSITAGGRPGDIDLPLEFPKENYPSTLQPIEDDTVVGGFLKPNFPNVAIGIDRKGPPVTSADLFTTEPGVLFSKNTFQLPTTTTSYAFTQTTTLPTVGGTETIDPVSTQRYYSGRIDSNRDYPQKTDTDYIDSYTPGSVQISDSNGVKSTNLPQSNFSFQKSRQFGVQRPRIDESGLDAKDFSNKNYPATQYGENLDNIPGITNPTDGSPSSDEYYDNQNPISFKQNKVGKVGSNNLQHPGTQENFNGENKSQHINSPINTLLPNQYTEKMPSSTNADISSYEYGSTRKYSTKIDNSSPRYDIRTHPERFQAESDRNAIIVNYENILTPEGFAYSFDTSNGIHADETGTAKDGVKAKGSYSYTGDDGKVYSIVYTADENGFLPRGDHLPTAPPIPEAILKVIEQATINKQLGIIDDGSYDEAKYGHGRYQGLMSRRPQVKLTNIIRKLPVNKDNALGQIYIGNENENGRPYNGQDFYSSDDRNFLPYNDKIKNNGVPVPGQVKSVSNPVFKGPVEQSTDNYELSNGKTMAFGPQYTSNNYQSDQRLPETTNVKNKNNIGPFGTRNFDEYPSTTPVTIIRKGYDQDISQLSERGYEYNHPQNLFSDNDGNSLKSGFLSTNRQNDKTEPEDKVNIKEKTLKPFMTPNVSFNFNSRRTDETMAKRPIAQSVSRPMTASEDKAIYTQNGNNDFTQSETSIPSNSNASDDTENEKSGVTDRQFSTRKPYGSTSSSFQNYETTYTPNLVGNGRQRYDYQTPTLRSQYDVTTPLPSEISSRLTPSTNRRVYSSQTTPTEYSTTLTPSISSETFGTTSYKPSNIEQINGVRIPTTSPDSYVSRTTGYGGDSSRFKDDRDYKQPIPQAGFEDEFKPTLGSSSRPNTFGSKTTERVVGEDFSGPKQSQTFDPVRGYYY